MADNKEKTTENNSTSNTSSNNTNTNEESKQDNPTKQNKESENNKYTKVTNFYNSGFDNSQEYTMHQDGTKIILKQNGKDFYVGDKVGKTDNFFQHDVICATMRLYELRDAAEQQEGLDLEKTELQIEYLNMLLKNKTPDAFNKYRGNIKNLEEKAKFNIKVQKARSRKGRLKAGKDALSEMNDNKNEIKDSITDIKNGFAHNLEETVVKSSLNIVKSSGKMAISAGKGIFKAVLPKTSMVVGKVFEKSSNIAKKVANPFQKVAKAGNTLKNIVSK